MPDLDLLAVARGDRPGDVLFTGGRVANVLSGALEEIDVVVVGSRIAGVGAGYEAHRTVDLAGRILLPGLIDAHVHLESSLVTPREFARAVVPRGTTTVITDPHEIANVHGLAGIAYMLDASDGLPLTVFVMASSCVPATAMSTAGADLHAGDLSGLRAHPRVLGLAEVMNFPGVIGGDRGVHAKIDAFGGRPIDGHAPGVREHALNAYIAGGPSSDHESTSLEEAREKLSRGLFVLIREATNARNLRDLLPLVNPTTERRTAFCTDDRQPPDLLDEGGIDHMVRVAIASGLDPMTAVRMATLNPAEHYGLADRGAVAPGRRADLIVVDDLEDLRVREVFVGGVAAARDGSPLEWAAGAAVDPPPPSMRVDWDRVDLRIPAGPARVRVIRAVPDQIVTGSDIVEPRVEGGEIVADPGRDLQKIAVIERHRGTGRVGLGLVTGMGIRTGAIAGTVAHDHHNLIVIGSDDRSMLAAARRVAETRGGLAVARDGRAVAFLPLPVAGLMSDGAIESVRRDLDAVVAAARELGSPLHDPFMAMSFLGLEVIPSLKITDRGLVDVERFTLTTLGVE